MGLQDQTKLLRGAGMDSDSAPESVAPEDIIFAQNMRFTGTAGQTSDYGTSIESTTLLSGSLLPGINNVIGGGKFDDVGYILMFRYNSAGNNQILLYNSATQTYQVLYTDLTNSGGTPLLPLNPQNEVMAILVNKTYAIWWAKDLEVGYCNLNTLISGGYGSTLLWEDLSLLKPQCLVPPTGVYGSDTGQPANYLYQNLPQFNVQYVNVDYNYSAWSTWSKRIVPPQENTPTLGASVSQNNYIIVTVNIGSIRTNIVNIGCRFGNNIFYNIKSVTRAYILALPNSTVNVATEVYEAYNAGINTYSFAFYNNTTNVPVATQETNLNYDCIWPSNAGGLLNGNIAALGDFKTLYPRPSIPVTIGAVGYNPNIAIPAGAYPNPLTKTGQFPGASGSGAGNHKRIMNISINGSPNSGDVVVIILADIRNANNTKNYSYPVTPGLAGNLLGVVQAITATLPNASYAATSLGYTITFIGDPYFGLQTYAIDLFFSGAPVANSIPSILDNSQYQLALSFRDYKGRFFPLCVDNTFMVATPSYAQVSGNAIAISWQINNATAPVGAVDYQWLITAPQVNNIVETMATLLVYKGSWNAKTNNPTLAAFTYSGPVGDTYQVGVPDSPLDSAYTNLGHNDTYDTGNYLVWNGKSFDMLPATFGNLPQNQFLALSLNPLKIFNADYAKQGVSTVLAYDFAVGDRCTMHYFIDGNGAIQYFNNPCVNLSVLGYEAGNYILKIENCSNFTISGGHILYNGVQIDGRNIFIRLYSPALQNQTSQTAVQATTVWYEIGERFPITNGQFSVLNGTIKDGGVYYQTGQFRDGINPYGVSPLSVLMTNLNYSVFYPSAFWSGGRTRTYYDELEQTTRAASIITSQNYILGSKNNGLTRFYPSTIYGDGDGQTSSSQGEIQILWQRGQQLVVLQERGVFYIPVNEAYTVVNDEITGQSISEKLLNNGRYASENVGIGLAKESFCTRFDTGFFVSPQYSEPFEIHVEAGIRSISKKMSKYFKGIIQLAYQQGKKMHMFYNEFYEEVVLCIQAEGGILTYFPFNTANWNSSNGFNILPGAVTSVTPGSHCGVSYNSTTGYLTITPASNYVGNDTASFTFNSGGSRSSNLCLTWVAGVTTVNAFSFAPKTNQPLSTQIQSNYIVVYGNNVPVPISITGGQYSVNGGAFTSAPGTVYPNDSVQVEVLSSASNSTTTSTTLTISGVSATFSATTVLAATATGILVVDIYTNTTINAYAYVATPGTDPYNIPAYTGQNFEPMIGSGNPATCWILASDIHTGTPNWRFQFNVGQLINNYPGINIFTFKIGGRDVSPGTISGQYNLQGGSSPQMIMSGSPGSYLPSVLPTNPIGAIPYSGKATVGGANGTYGIGIGADILVFTYNVATQTMTLA